MGNMKVFSTKYKNIQINIRPERQSAVDKLSRLAKVDSNPNREENKIGKNDYCPYFFLL